MNNKHNFKVTDYSKRYNNIGNNKEIGDPEISIKNIERIRLNSEILSLIEQYHDVINKLDKCKGNNSQLNLLLREKTKIQLKLHKLTLLTSESNTTELINKVVQKRNETIKRLFR
ncbi:MAG: hypothetical protein J5634_03650 [Bacilli bacterium]|nr:hypothetical protein [Bacilli bacterium]